jgi:hypothetical protein
MKHIDLMEADMYDPSADKTHRRMSDTRKPRIMLKDLNRLRKMREAKKAEQAKSTSTFELMYGASKSE